MYMCYIVQGRMNIMAKDNTLIYTVNIDNYGLDVEDEIIENIIITAVNL